MRNSTDFVLCFSLINVYLNIFVMSLVNKKKKIIKYCTLFQNYRKEQKTNYNFKFQNDYNNNF